MQRYKNSFKVQKMRHIKIYCIVNTIRLIKKELRRVDMQLTGSEIVIECLKEQGVDTVFGYPGGTILNIYDALYKHPEIRHHG